MLINESTEVKQKKSKNSINVYISPYFTSLRRSCQNNKNKKSPPNT
jgi:hypothetical protein